MKHTCKRFLAIAMTLAIVLSMLPLSAMAEDAVPHQHNYTSAVTQEATCGAAGVTTFTCAVEGCDRPTYTEAIAATGNHSYAEGVCTVCGAAEPAAHQHNYTSAVTQEATCGAAGVTTYTCAVEGCDRPTYTEPIAATGNHSYTEGVCTVCGGAEHQHNYTSAVTQEATCGAAGVTTFTCAVEGCDRPTYTEPIAATGNHNYAEGVCTVCGAAEPAVCDGTENCTAETHETTCECYDWCAALGCTEEVHHADCPWGPCTLTEGCKLVKGHEGECTGMAPFIAVAKVGETPYNTLAEAMANAAGGSTITLLDNVTVDSETYTIADGKSLTLDMNGKKITATDNKAANVNYELFYIYGELNVTGSGTIELTSTSNDTSWAKSSTIFHNRGGVLTVQSGTFKHQGGTCMAYVIDNSGNWYGDATTNIQGGTLSSTYIAIRNRMDQNEHGASGKAILNISGGSISGTSRAVWAQASSTSTTAPATGEINVSGGSVGLIDTARSNGAECMTTISGGTVAAFKGEAGELTVKGSGAISGTVTLMDAAGKEVGFTVTDEGLYIIAVAQIGDKAYTTLAEAIEDAASGATITLLSNITFDEETRTHNSGTWYDGLYYVGDKSFTLDLAGFTITHDGSVNDYLLNFKNDGSKANEITIKNGTLDAGTAAFCAICTSSGSTQKITINLENVKAYNNISNGSAIKVRGGAVLNVKNDTVITGKNSYLGIECVASTVNIYDGAEIYMNGTSSYNGCLVGVCSNGTVNVYGGYGKGVKGGFIAMTSGGTINVSGGEWIANTNGAVGNNSNLYVLTAQNNSNEDGYAGASIINVTGGTFRGGMDAWILNQGRNEVAELNISGGNFNANPSNYLADGYVAAERSGIWTVDLPVAEVGSTKYTSLAEAIASAQQSSGTVKLLSDLAVDSETYTISDGKSVTLDMNGKKITVTDKKTSNYELFYIYGGLTVTGNGTIELTATNDRDWNAMSAIFHNRGGVLTIQNGTFKHLGGTDMAYVVDNSGNWYGDATTNVQGGTLSSTYIAIRNRMEENSHGASGKAILNISGGTISGTSRAVWAQAASASTTAPATGEINVSGGSVGLIDTARSDGAECMTTISGGTVAAFKGEVDELTVKDNGRITGTVTMMDAAGNEVDFAITDVGLYTTAVAQIGETCYADLQTAIDNADGKTVVLLKNVETTVALNIASGKTVTIDLNEKTLTTAGIINSGTLTVEDGAVVGGPNDTIRSTGTLTLNNVNATGTRHVLRIVSGTAIINGGEYKPTGTAGTRHALNVGDEDAPTTNKATVTINGGTFIGPAGTTMDSGSAVCVQNGSAVIVPETSTAVFKGGKNATLSAQTGATLTVKGGIYDQDPSDYVAADYKAVQKSANQWEIVERDYVAQIGTTKKYESLQDAVNGATASETITLLADVTLTEGITADKNLTIDANGHAIKGSNVTLKPASGKTLRLIGLGTGAKLGVDLSANDTATADADGVITVATAGTEYGSMTLLSKDTQTGIISSRKVFVASGTKLVIQYNSTGFDKNTFNGEYMLDMPNKDKVYSGTLNADDLYTEYRNYENIYVRGTNNTLTIVSSAFFDTCKRIYVDNSTVYLKETNYSMANVLVARGCTELEMKSGFLTTLATGKHTVKFVHMIDTNGDGVKDECVTTAEFWVKSSGSVADPTCPKTGDYIMIAVGVLGVSVAALAVLLIIRKKKS